MKKTTEKMNEPATETTENWMEAALAYLQGEGDDAARAEFEAALADSEEARRELEKARETLNALSATRDDAVVSAVNALIREAIVRGASDIHLTPEKSDAPMRAFLRLHGALIETPFPAENAQTWAEYPAYLNRIKLMAEMNPLERRLPQDGRVPIRHQGRDYDLRISDLPTLYGERLTVRILSKEAYPLGFDALNLPAEAQETLQRLMRLPSGLILVAGRAQSGRTSLIYSLLKEMAAKTGRRAILTAEYPIELALDGVVQSGADAAQGVTLSVLLHAQMRADPDVIYCSAIPDPPTADNLVRSAELGCVSFAAVPGADALSGLDRLTDLGVARYRIADVAAAFIGLRLVGKVCESCAERYTPNPDDLEGLDLSPTEDGPFVRGRGCDKCGGTGFSGRVPLCEIAVIDGPIRRRIARGVSTADLWTEIFASSDNRSGSLRDAARAAVRSGQTTAEAALAALADYPYRAPVDDFPRPTTLDLPALERYLLTERK